MKIIIVVPFLNGIGGIQSSLINLLNNLCSEYAELNYEISLCVFGNVILNKENIHESIKIIRGSEMMELCLKNFSETLAEHNYQRILKASFIKSLKTIFGFDFVISYLVKHIKINGDFDVAIAYSNDIYKSGKRITGGSNEIVLESIKASKKLAWVHNDAYELGYTQENCIKMFENFDSVVNVSFASKMKFDDIAPYLKYKSKVVYNMVDLEKSNRLSLQIDTPYDHCVFNIVTVARIDNQQKKINRIIECCKALKEYGVSKFKWTIIGSGRDLEDVKSLINKYGLNEIVECLGKKENPFPYIKYADLFVLSSAYEAYPMVILESLSLKTPVVTTGFDSAEELVQNNITGFICNNSTEGLIEILQFILANQECLTNIKKNLLCNLALNSKAVHQFRDLVEN